MRPVARLEVTTMWLVPRWLMVLTAPKLSTG
jgi:hypothetical protein